jgi:hypothetical protein
MPYLRYLTPFFYLYLPLAINRLCLFVLQQKSLGLVAPLHQLSVGSANDIFIAALLFILFALFGTLFSSWQKFHRHSLRALSLLAIFIYSFTLANTIFVFYTRQNMSLHELSYFKDLPILWGSARTEIRLASPLLWAGGGSLVFMCWCLRRAFFAPLFPGKKPITSPHRLYFFVCTLLLALGSRSFSLSQRTVLHEPVETHILPYLAWNYRLAQKFSLAQPAQGFAALAAHQQALIHAQGGASLQPEFKGPQNVVLILLESFGQGKLAENPRSAPFISSLLHDPHSVVLENHYTNVYRTIGAQYSMLCSRHDPLSFYVIRDYPQKKSLCLPEYLGERGYQSLWVSGSKAEFDYNAEWLALHKVEKQYSELEFLYQEDKKSFSYGVHDEIPLGALSEILTQQAQPFFAYVLTISNHHPWVFPEDFVAAHPLMHELDESARGFYYTDVQLEKFFARARTQAWFDHTLFVLVGDHAPWGYASDVPESAQDYEYFRRRYHTTTLLWHSGFSAPLDAENRVISADTSHVDIAPTILALLGIASPQEFVGQNIFSPQRVMPVIGSQDNNRDSLYQIHNAEEVIRFDIKSGVCMNFRAGTAGSSPCDEDKRGRLFDFKQTFYDTVQWEFGDRF